MTSIDTGVLLAAGEGSRLRAAAGSKPLCHVAGRPLIEHALTGMAAAGLERAIVVTGYRADAVEDYLAGRDWPIAVEVVRSLDWRLPNGVSVLSAAPLLGEAGAVLAMCDHLVDPALYRRLAQTGHRGGLSLGIDRRLGHHWVDPLDVTCVRTEGDRIVAIGKGLEPHDCYDTGVFAIGPALFDALRTLDAPSLSLGVGQLAAQQRAWIIDCSDIDWIDVDDPAALALATRWLVDQGATA